MTTTVSNEFVYAPMARPISLPLVETRYPLFWRSDAWKWWKSVVALIVAGVLGFVAMGFVPLIAIILDTISGRLTAEDLQKMAEGILVATPNVFLFNNLGIALGIPVAWLAALFVGQRPGFLSSVIGRFRWKWFLLVGMAILPIWMGILALELVPAVQSGEFAFERNSDTVFLIFAILLTTPLQCAGEEFLDRGVINRGFASFWNHPIGGPMLGAIVSSSVFMFMHSADDFYLNAFYFAFGMTACWLTWRTGGLEAAIAVHLVNNMTSMITLPFSDISGMFDRTEGSADIATLGISLIGPVVAVVVVEVLYRWRQPVAVAAPGLAQLAAPSLPMPGTQRSLAAVDPYQLPLPSQTAYTQIPVFPAQFSGHRPDEDMDLTRLPPPST